MPREHQYFVYILTNATRVLYIGMTSNLQRRVWQHRTKAHDGYTADYHVSWLVYYEELTYVRNAIAREKQLKGWRREKTIALIESMNPEWRDLAMEWFPGDLSPENADRE